MTIARIAALFCFFAIAQIQKAAEATEPSTISEAEITRMKIAEIFLPEFSAEDITLDEALRILTQNSQKYAKRGGYRPVQFRSHRTLAKRKVTLLTKTNSMKTICAALAEQISARLVFGESEVVFDLGDSDGIE